MASAALPASCWYIIAWRSDRNGSRCILILYLPTVSLYYLGKARVCSRKALKRFYFFAAHSHTSLLPVGSGTGSRLASYLFEPFFIASASFKSDRMSHEALGTSLLTASTTAAPARKSGASLKTLTSSTMTSRPFHAPWLSSIAGISRLSSRCQGFECRRLLRA